MAKKTLPDTLSALLRVAVADAQACEAQPERFTLDMGVWFDNEGAKCVVCMAGSTIAKTLGAELLPVDLEPTHFDTSTRDRLCAIDYMRQGDIYEASIEVDSDGYRASQEAREKLDALSARIHDAIDHEKQRAPWPVYLEVATELEALGL
jgi:hypothetical protein